MLCAVLIITVFSDISFAQHNIAEADKSTLSNPRIVPDKSRKARQKMKWDCIWFGSYPQAEVVPAGSEYTALPEEVFEESGLIQARYWHCCTSHVSCGLLPCRVL